MKPDYNNSKDQKNHHFHSIMENETGQIVAHKAVATYSMLWVLQAVATITFTLRIISRYSITRDVGWEDIIMAFGWAVNLAATILMTLSIHAIVHTKDCTENLKAKTSDAHKLSFIAAALVPNAAWLPKISVALLLSRLLHPRAVVKAILIVSSIVGSAAGGIGSAFLMFIQCSPISGQWDRERIHPKCWNPRVMVNYFLVWTVLSASLDVLYAIYPATIFWKMRQLPICRKLIVSILMGLGLISAAVGIYKTTLTPLLRKRDQGSDIALVSTHIVIIWSIIEADIIISAACIPLTRSFWLLVMSYVKSAWKCVRTRVGLGPPIVDLDIESIETRRDHGGYLELSGSMRDVNVIVSGDPEQRTPFRDEIDEYHQMMSSRTPIRSSIQEYVGRLSFA
ncbi:conserved hypothetical protein [Talaromyces stipitatus ATCC 10500]|uniref:Rhodopsin domain-containing protein n=1 Tax=Talaromyces stipitatus (strain ATCC 10500 / CBS 375.48 / QM 6759 / NRRL 1006) TaxID=441959 RepID=B8MGR6_TALSN|nr:uncharacterized protein TSTA_013950 [Talaromyces stipitatus ATCC 10500]EED16297.1 conserved hypothetical protein [Talaromyces stipitatus ATCC 10500]